MHFFSECILIYINKMLKHWPLHFLLMTNKCREIKKSVAKTASVFIAYSFYHILHTLSDSLCSMKGRITDPNSANESSKKKEQWTKINQNQLSLSCAVPCALVQMTGLCTRK